MLTSELKEPRDIEWSVSLSESGSEKSTSVVYNVHVDVSGIDEAKLMRKIDRQLLPWLSFLYLLTFLGRTSIGNAKVHFDQSPRFRSTLTYASDSSTIWQIAYASTIKNICCA